MAGPPCRALVAKFIEGFGVVLAMLRLFVSTLAAASSLFFLIFLRAWSSLDIPLAPLPGQIRRFRPVMMR